MDSGLGISLERFAAAHNAWVAGGRKQPLSIDGQPIEDLCLSFELPGALPDLLSMQRTYLFPEVAKPCLWQSHLSQKLKSRLADYNAKKPYDMQHRSFTICKQ